MHEWHNRIIPRFQKIVDVLDSCKPIGYEATIVGTKGETAEIIFNKSYMSGTVEELDREARWLTVENSGFVIRDGALLFVNVSNFSVRERNIDFPPNTDLSGIVLEITEQIEITMESVKVFKELSDRGVKLALDDFGRGYSNFELYTKLPISFIKLDKFFAADVCTNRSTSEVVRFMQKMCGESGNKLVVEGVETEEQKDKLLSVGVQYMQGYYFGYPEAHTNTLNRSPLIRVDGTA